MVGNYTADLGPRPLCARLLPVSFKSVDPFLGPFFFLCAFCFSFPTFLFEARTLSVFPRCKGAGRHHIIIIIIDACRKRSEGVGAVSSVVCLPFRARVSLCLTG